MGTKEIKVDESKTVDRKAIFTGIVSHIKVVDVHDTTDSKAVVIKKNGSKKVIALDIRKVAFEEKDGYGRDILYKLNMQDYYTYKIVNEMDSELENNTIVIRDPRELNDVLYYVGFPSEIKKSGMGEIKKTVFSNDDILRIKAHNVKLTKNGVLDERRIMDINAQASGLYAFKQLDLPTTPQKKEKVYAKYFK